MPKIRFLCHDNPRPSGGIRTLYRHVDLLCAAGFDAAIVHGNPEFRLQWFAHNTPIENLHRNFGSDDWIVFPEDYIHMMDFFRDIDCNKVVFCQNHFYIFEALPYKVSWQDFGITHVLGSSKEIQKYIHQVFGLSADLIPYCINHDIFVPTDKPRELVVSYMPRKGQVHLKQMIQSMWFQYPQIRDIQWVEIDGYTESEVANILQRSAVFISTVYREGFGLPPIEAMACGALVVGFTAGGGRDFASKSNGFWVPDEQSIELTNTLARVLLMYKKNPQDAKLMKVRNEGYKTAQKYNKDRTNTMLLQAWKKLLNCV